MQPHLSKSEVQTALAELRRRKASVFGSSAHGFLLNAPLRESKVQEFEYQHAISLPADYRSFIATIGNGGAGPAYGVFPLGYSDGATDELKPWREKEGLIGDLRAPFPLLEAWNDLSMLPSDDLLNTDLPAYDRAMERFDERYFAPSLMNGAFPICHLGCALRIWLVVRGEQVGFLWRDGRAEQTGLSPVRLKNGEDAQFAAWYMEWLNEALATIK